MRHRPRYLPAVWILIVVCAAGFSFGLGSLVSHASVTVSGSGITGNSAFNSFTVPGTPPASSSSSLLELGPNVIDGSASGTFIGVNPSSFSGDFLNFQVGSSTKFAVDALGNVGANEFYGSTVATPYPNLSFTSSGGVNINAGGTNQSITLSPSGSGATVVNNLEDKGGQVYNVKAYGAKGNGAMLFDATMTSGSADLSSASASFTSADVGKLICVAGAGTSGGQLCTTISSVIDANNIVLAVPASTSVTSAAVTYASNDDAAFNATLAAVEVDGGVFYVPPGIYGLTEQIALPPGVPIIFKGAGDSLTNTANNYINNIPATNAMNGSRLVWLTTSLSGPAFAISGTSGNTNWTASDVLEDISLIGGAGNNRDGGGGNGLNVTNWEDAAVRNVGIANFAGNGIYVDALAATTQDVIENVTFTHVHVYGNNGNGIQIGPVGSWVEVTVVRNSIIEYNGGMGVDINSDFQSVVLTGNTIQWDNLNAANPEVYVSGNGINPSCLITGNYIESDGVLGSKSTGPFNGYANECTIFGNYLNGGSAKQVQLDAEGDITVPGNATLHNINAASGNTVSVDTNFAFMENPPTVTGTTAGSFQWSEPEQGLTYKKVILTFIGFENTSSTAQTLTFPAAFYHTPAVMGCTLPAGITITTSGLSAVSMSAPFTGQCIVEGL